MIHFPPLHAANHVTEGRKKAKADGPAAGPSRHPPEEIQEGPNQAQFTDKNGVVDYPSFVAAMKMYYEVSAGVS